MVASSRVAATVSIDHGLTRFPGPLKLAGFRKPDHVPGNRDAPELSRFCHPRKLRIGIRSFLGSAHSNTPAPPRWWVCAYRLLCARARARTRKQKATAHLARCAARWVGGLGFRPCGPCQLGLLCFGLVRLREPSLYNFLPFGIGSLVHHGKNEVCKPDTFGHF